MRHLEPDLVAGEREDGREDLCHGIENDPQCALCRAAGGGIRAVAVQAVFDDIEIEARKRDDAEIVDGVGNGQEFIILIRRLALDQQFVQLRDGPAVERFHIGGRGQLVGIKIGQIVEAELRRVAELEIVLAQLLEDLIGAAHIDVIIRRACPQAADVRAVFLEHVRRIDAVAEGLVHGLALAVDRPAVRDALFKGSALPKRADRRQKARLEPAAVLIKALKVDRRGPEALILLHGSKVRRAGVEPAVKRICFLLKVPAAAVRAGEAFGDEFVRVLLEPDV